MLDGNENTLKVRIRSRRTKVDDSMIAHQLSIPPFVAEDFHRKWRVLRECACIYKSDFRCWANQEFFSKTSVKDCGSSKGEYCSVDPRYKFSDTLWENDVGCVDAPSTR